MEAAWNDGHRFSGRVALVTGAGGTLGGAVARGFGGEGASVLVGYRGSREAAESVAGDVVAGGGAASAFQLDVTDQASVDRFVEQADALYGRIDVLVNAAGRLEAADTVRFEHMSADAAAALLAVDVIGAMRMCHAVIPHMRRHGHGAIINFSSTYGNGINPENAINWVPVTYCAAKGAIRGLTTSLARDVAPGDPCQRTRSRPDLRQLGAGVGRCPRAHRRGKGDEPNEAFRRPPRDRRDSAVPRIGRRRRHQRPGNPCGRRLGPSRVTLAVTGVRGAASLAGLCTR